MALPDWPSWIATLTCLGRSSGLGNAASFAGRKESSGLGSIASFPWRKVSNSLGRTAAFTQGKVSSYQGRIAYFAGRKVSNCWRRVRGNAWYLTVCMGRAGGLGNAASFAGRKGSSGLGSITSFLGRMESNSLGRTATCACGKVSSCWERIVSFPGRKVSNCQRRVRGNTWCLTACWGRINGLGRTTYFPRGKESACLTVSLGCVITFPGGSTTCLTDWEPKLLDWMRFIALALVIFPSFLLIKILNLFKCLCLTLLNLISLTLLMKSWHSLSLSAEIIDASWVLHSSVCLVTWS